MANQEIVEKLKEAMKSPEFWARLAEAQRRAEETNAYLREAGRPKAN